MRNFVIAAALASLAVATPALAQDEIQTFAGARVGVELGVIDDDAFGTDSTTYGFIAGYDFDLGGAVVGATAGYTDAFDNDFGVRELSLSGRVGAKVAPRTLLYATAGYSNIDADGLPGSFDGVKAGVGLEQSFGRLYGTIETRYGNYEAGLEAYQTVVGVGVRF